MVNSLSDLSRPESKDEEELVEIAVVEKVWMTVWWFELTGAQLGVV